VGCSGRRRTSSAPGRSWLRLSAACTTRRCALPPVLVYGRAWHAARQAALGPDLATTALARRPYDLRHAALSLSLNASGTPAEVVAQAGNSARVLHEIYLHCTDGQDDTVSQRIEDAVDAGAGIMPPGGKASGYTHRRNHPRPCPLYVREPVPGPAHSPRPSGPADPQYRMQTPTVTTAFAAQAASETLSAETGRCPEPAHA
jgi:hypothetical protein